MLIRRARPDDVDVILELIRDLATYERAPEQARASAQQLRAVLFGEPAHVFCDVVEAEGDVVGFALWFLSYSTWSGTLGIYLEDLFVRPQHRGLGYGKALLAGLARECVTSGYHRLQWSVLDWNRPAIDFYESLGAIAQDEWTVYRVSGEALDRLSAVAG
jgi:GNAT superfamily N-acetyltransferase